MSTSIKRDCRCVGLDGDCIPLCADLKPCYCGNFDDNGWHEVCDRACEHEENQDAQ